MAKTIDLVIETLIDAGVSRVLHCQGLELLGRYHLFMIVKKTLMLCQLGVNGLHR